MQNYIGNKSCIPNVEVMDSTCETVTTVARSPVRIASDALGIEMSESIHRNNDTSVTSPAFLDSLVRTENIPMTMTESDIFQCVDIDTSSENSGLVGEYLDTGHLTNRIAQETLILGRASAVASSPMRVISDKLRMEMSGLTHSNDDTLTLLSSAISDSLMMTDSISKTIRESVNIRGVDTDISLETCSLVDECVDVSVGLQLGDPMEGISLPLNSTQHKRNILLTPTNHSESGYGVPSCDYSTNEIGHETVILASEASISIGLRNEGSMSVLEQTPQISDDIATPDLSQVKDVEISSTEEELSIMNIGTGIKNKDIGQILVGVGYSPSVVGDILSSIENEKYVEQKDTTTRPQTRIFTQGKVYTYPEIETSKKNAKFDQVTSRRNTAVSSLSGGNLSYPKLGHMIPTSLSTLNPEATPFESCKPNHDALTVLKNIRIDNLKNVIIGQLNINSLRNQL